MGIIEFHFHDPEFDFSPSMSTGGDEATDDEAVDDADDDGDWGTESVSDTSPGAGVGAILALVVLVGLAVLAGLKRRNGAEETDDEIELEA